MEAMHGWVPTLTIMLCLVLASIADASPFDHQIADVEAAVLVAADESNQAPLVALTNGAGWHDPRVYGGRMLDVSLCCSIYERSKLMIRICKYASPDKGEPLNVIISANSDPFILTDSGFQEYAK